MRLQKLLVVILAASLAATFTARAVSEKKEKEKEREKEKDSEPVRLSRPSFEYAKTLIQEGHVTTDADKAWSAAAPTKDEANRFIGKHGWAQYGKWHLGVSESLRETTKHRYKFPFGDFTNVYRSALVAAKARAAQYHENDIRDAATELLAMIDKQGPAPQPTPEPSVSPKKTGKKK